MSETRNVAESTPDVVERLAALMRRYIDEGRSTVGTLQKNEADISVEASAAGNKKKGNKSKKKFKEDVALARDPTFD